MWLSKDEMRLIEGYAAKIGRPGLERQFQLCALTRFIKASRPSKVTEKVLHYWEAKNVGEGQQPLHQNTMKQIPEYIDKLARIEVAHTLLVERGLIAVEKHEHHTNLVRVKLTVAGYDLGRKYARWATRSGEWFEEYRNHWLFLIVGFFGGVLGALLVDVLKGLVRSP